MAHKTKPRGTRSAIAAEPAKVVDLFCGIGGLSHGLVLEGFKVVAGVDNDETCKFAFEKNNDAKFIRRNIARFTPKELKKLFDGASVRILVGCAPCQPYSALGRTATDRKESRKRWYPLSRFLTLIKEVQPEIVSMENVPDLSDEKKYPVFGRFVRTLEKLGYTVSHETVDASRYGVPQKRRRLVLLASKLGAISLIRATHPKSRTRTVRHAIKKLPRLQAGSVDVIDSLHRASALSTKNKARIAATPRNGGSAKSWPSNLVPKCYRKKSGKSYMTTVYGRMRWKDPAPTMTTHCTTLGTGRFGHPSQNRAISLREAAIFQSFPRDYVFAKNDQISITRTARHIGNAVPVRLGRIIGRSIKKHLQEHV